MRTPLTQYSPSLSRVGREWEYVQGRSLVAGDVVAIVALTDLRGICGLNQPVSAPLPSRICDV